MNEKIKQKQGKLSTVPSGPNGENSGNGKRSTHLGNSRWQTFWQAMKRTKYLHLMLLPGVIYYIVFKYLPMYGVVIAFKDYNMFKGILASDWVGLENFRSFFEYPFFWRLIRNTVLLNVYNLLWSFPAPIVFALMLNEVRNIRSKKFIQTVSYLPHFISTVSIVGILFLILSPQTGFVNRIIVSLGGEPIYFMAENSWFRTIYVASNIWQNMGWDAIIYLAALTAVSPELYEAAQIDGASRLRQMWHITLPAIKPTIVTMLILRMGQLMNSSTDKVLLMQSPITYEVSDIIGTFVYRRGLISAEYSFGTAIDFFNSVINITLLLIANKVSKELTDSGLF